MKIAVLTDRRWVRNERTDAYAQTIAREDGLIVAALKSANCEVDRVAWDDASVNWSAYTAALFRTTWDYFERFGEFSRWHEEVRTQTRLINSGRLVKWNLDKHYLIDLINAGVPTVATRIAEKGDAIGLEDWLRGTGWSEAVLKPVVSGAGRHTYRVSTDNASALDGVFRELLANEAMMLQPFMPEILSQGEISLMVMGDHVTHAVRKVAKPGEFRVQDDHGGTVQHCDVEDEHRALAKTAMSACPERPLYARVDMVASDSGYQIMELELVEPELFFRLQPDSAEVLARAIVASLSEAAVHP